MLTIFSTPKPFVGHVGVIQRNALQSWRRLHQDIEIILVGDDPGTAEVCAELGLRHIPEVRKNQHGTKYLASIYDQAQAVARHEVLCHANCDIILMGDFLWAAERVANDCENFLMAGCRWDVDLHEPLDFENLDWEEDLRTRALRTNRQRPPKWIDYFVFRKGFYYGKIPEFVIGRPGWDNWLLWYPSSVAVPVIDASKMVMAVHQNHDYGYHPDGEAGVWQGEEAQENYRLHSGKYATLEDATHLVRPWGVARNYKPVTAAKRGVIAAWYRAWFGLLNLTRPVRRRLGLRSGSRIRKILGQHGRNHR